MRLIRAKFKNFRLLHDLSLEFSCDDEKILTVIRAENQSGKTTILTALQWALYGDDALPKKRKDYRLHPIDWDVPEGEKAEVEISVSVDFETVVWRGEKPEKHEYRIVRSVSETVAGEEWEPRSSPTTNFYKLNKERGTEPIDNPEAYIKKELPPELREVFFTDGDRALYFIENPSERDKRDRVEAAIRSLLGLDVVKDALKHVGGASSEVNKKSQEAGEGDRLGQIAANLEKTEKEIEKKLTIIKSANEQISNFDEAIKTIKKDIKEAARKGNRKDLEEEIISIEHDLKYYAERKKKFEEEHSNLFRSMELARDLLPDILKKSLGRLSELSSQEKIPTTTIPVLEEQLKKSICICGESLKEKESAGKKRRENIKNLIKESQNSDKINEILTRLYYSTSSWQTDDKMNDEDSWVSKYKTAANERCTLKSNQDEKEKKLKALGIRLKGIPNTNISALQTLEEEHELNRNRQMEIKTIAETELKQQQEIEKKQKQEHEKALREKDKHADILAEFTVIKDIQLVLDKSLTRIKTEELEKVSDYMNNLFLEMIGVDPEQSAAIQSSEITKDYDIVVYGHKKRTLNPDSDLNGASRRALTLSFILALTKVSEVKAPNVIDTPLGMMSGYVKESVLKTVIRESTQLILFLTPAEIKDCEEILKREAGKIITLTNSAHYPKMLVNNPQTDKEWAMRCECTNLGECGLCKRKSSS